MFNAVVEPYDADAVRQSLINHGKAIMNTQSNQIQCDTGVDEHNHNASPSTSIITSSQGNLGTNVPIQGVSGAVYAPMDTNPQPQEQDQNARVKMLMDMLTTTLNQLVKELQTPTQPQTDLEEAVSTALEQAEWFKEMVEDTAKDLVEEQDFDYEIGNNIERYMRNSFDANDHYDFDSEVRARVEDEVESVIDGLVADAVEERLADLLEEKLKNASITINF